jgi:hypothetical protein
VHIVGNIRRKLRIHVKEFAHYKSMNFAYHDMLGVFIRKVDLPSTLARALARYNNEGFMRAVLKDYANNLRKYDPLVSICPLHGEDYELQWGKTDYRGKIVLDVGADVGSTAAFFLKKGAKKVIAVEGAEVCFARLKANASIFKDILPVFAFVDSPNHIENMIQKWIPDIVKMDIEGHESNLFQIKDEVFNKVPTYIVEVHSDRLLNSMLKKCIRNNYRILSIHAIDPPVRIVLAERRTLKENVFCNVAASVTASRYL